MGDKRSLAKAAVGQQVQHFDAAPPSRNSRREPKPARLQTIPLSGANRDRTGDLLLAKRNGETAESPSFAAFTRVCRSLGAAWIRRN